MSTDEKFEETTCPVCGNWTWENTDNWIERTDKPPHPDKQSEKCNLCKGSGAYIEHMGPMKQPRLCRCANSLPPKQSEGELLKNLLNACQNLKTSCDMMNTGELIASTEEYKEREDNKQNAIKSVINIFIEYTRTNK